jgi:hypothetical protein
MKNFLSIFMLSVLTLSMFNFKTVFASDDVNLNLGVTGGTLTMSLDSLTTITLSSIAINDLIAANQETKSAFHNFSVTDGRGTGDGWNIQVSSTQFIDGANTLPANRTFVDGSTLVFDGANITNNIATKNTMTDGSPISIVSAGLNKGMGEFDLSSLDVGYDFLSADVATLKAGTYVSTLTVGVITGP